MNQKMLGLIKKDISNKIKKQRGFTLVEVIVTVAIIGIISTSILYFFGFSMESLSMSGRRTDNVLDAEEMIDEEIKDYENKSTSTIKVKIITKSKKIIEKEIKGDILEAQDENIKIQTFMTDEVKRP